MYHKQYPNGKEAYDPTLHIKTNFKCLEAAEPIAAPQPKPATKKRKLTKPKPPSDSEGRRTLYI